MRDRALQASASGSGAVDLPLLLALVGLVAVATVALIFAERRDSLAGIWIAKPLASVAFVALGVADGWPDDSARRWLVAALVLCLAGDVLLIPREPRVFRLSILTFLAGHLAFLGGFLALGVAWSWAALALVPLVAAAVLVGRWLLPKVQPGLKGAVLAYMVVITAMVAVAAGAVAGGVTPLLLLAATAFWANDILVARDRFAGRDWRNRLYGLPMYYGAMVLFALIASGSLV